MTLEEYLWTGKIGAFKMWGHAPPPGRRFRRQCTWRQHLDDLVTIDANVFYLLLFFLVCSRKLTLSKPL